MHFIPFGMTSSAYILSVLDFVRKNVRQRNAWFFVAACIAGLALRLFFVFRFPAVVDDSRLYANIATNWLQHGVYGITDSGQVVPTLSRLPGYPAFLAAVFATYGPNNFRAVLLIQSLIDLGTCFLIANLAAQVFRAHQRAAEAAFLLAALCPFLANYAAAALTETLEIFFTTLALNLAVRGLANLQVFKTSNKGLGAWLGCGLSIAGCILLRPDGGILLAAVLAYLCLLFRRDLIEKSSQEVDSASRGMFPILRAGIILVLASVGPLVPWTLRNLHTFHRFQPLAPRYANDSDELVMSGFNRWTKTWIADYASVQEIYWNVPGDAIDITRLPTRSFDSPAQFEQTRQLFADYNLDRDITPELDARFAALAAERIRQSPLRYYVWLPALRIADMWLRPRTELLPPDPRWWEFNDEPRWLALSIAFGLVNLLYVGAAAEFLRTRISRNETSFSIGARGVGLLFLFVAMRSLFLGTLENPEPRYTLECYPVVIVAAAALFINKSNGNHRKAA